MGVPSLFKNIVEFDEKIYYYDPKITTDYLFIDFNNLIHRCKNQINSHSEEDLISEVIRYTSYLITKVVKPRKLVYLAVDGPVPYGKMIRQRARRHKKIQDSSYRRKLEKKFNIESKHTFDSNKITPGTVFMTKLSSRLRNFASLGAFNSHVNKGCKFNFILSDTSVPGEGEHKIMKFIKSSFGTPKITIY